MSSSSPPGEGHEMETNVTEAVRQRRQQDSEQRGRLSHGGRQGRQSGPEQGGRQPGFEQGGRQGRQSGPDQGGRQGRQSGPEQGGRQGRQSDPEQGGRQPGLEQGGRYKRQSGTDQGGRQGRQSGPELGGRQGRQPGPVQGRRQERQPHPEQGKRQGRWSDPEQGGRQERQPGLEEGGRQGRRSGPGQRGRQPGPKQGGKQGREQGLDPRKGHVMFLTMHELRSLANDTPQKVVQSVVENEEGFMSAFSFVKNCTIPLNLKCLIAILYKLTKSNEDNLASRMLGQIFSAEGKYALFCFQIDVLVKRMPNEMKREIKEENLTYLLYLIEIGLFGIQKVPRTMIDSFPRATLTSTIEKLNENGENVRILPQKCMQLKEQFDLARLQTPAIPVTTTASQSESTNTLEPPEPFTTIPVLPQEKDLKGGSKFKPFLRPNIVKGAYQGWDHYLDVQFRLLREDFIAPLREGIQTYYEGLTRRVPEIRVYEQVRVLAPVCLFAGVGFQISFNTQKLQRVNWEHSRRLIFGSLICLSRDEFRRSIFFATVVKSDPKELKMGRLIVKFEGDINGFQLDSNHEFLMAESTAYFEAYRHVLLALQNVSNIQETMPFKSYLIDCNKNDVNLPLYVRSNSMPSFNISGILRKGHGRVILTQKKSWPHFSSTDLDQSQFDAIKMATTQELSLVQGPPGTGKTFVGLKMMQLFLQNRQIWDPNRNFPILVVCYTNHALDQFLEGIISENCCPDADIVRIGGRCKSENLSKYLLHNKVQTVRSERTIPRDMHNRSKKARDKMNQVKTELDKFQEMMNLSEGKLLALITLATAIHPLHYFQLTEGRPTERGREIEVWLELWYPSQHEYQYPKPHYFEENSQGAHPNPGSDAPGADQSEHEYITVDEEARILREERMAEGEQIELDPQMAPKQIVPEPCQTKKKSSKSEWSIVQMSDQKRKKMIESGLRRNNAMRKKQVEETDDVWQLNLFKRWQLYLYWVNKYLNEQKKVLQWHGEIYNAACDRYTEAKEEIDCFVARKTDVVAMTTTGAAKHHHILKNVNTRIVIVEEAAEVFESHIITSLSPSVQQLILIGDHKQLRPKPNHYELEKKYNFAISLFERLIMNGIPHVTLGIQHRMRPEIADLIRPAIYAELTDAQKVKDYECIHGVSRNVLFIDHDFPERSNPDGDNRSHANEHEANYMVALCRYLLKQGYTPDKITLLTMYRGQLLEMKRRMKRKDFEGVRVAAVDDYQGEENDIILLSLVRSNSNGKIGFLKNENRICVSLSRAKKGLYVIGNFSMLQNQTETVWPAILSVVNDQKCKGKGLPLCCQIHPDQKVVAQVPEDFSKCPEGGCQKPCNARLKCGHKCPRMCHPMDREHKLFMCQKPCTKTLYCGHTCKGKCYQCADGCVPCSTVVEKKIPHCGHKMELKCHQNPMRVPCTHQCERQLVCGHYCQKYCSQPCTSQCTIPVDRDLPCGHKMNVPCYQKAQDIKCTEKCKEILLCEHPCQGTCGSCHQGRLHIRCQSECGRNLVCGHICNFPCSAECPPCLKLCKNYCTHSKCPKRCYEPCDPCKEDCNWKCEHLQCTRKCGEICNRPPCNEPCLKRLRCGHPCIGLCGEKCPKLCRICNPEKVEDIFFGTEDEPDARFIQLEDCGHVLEYSGMDEWMKQSGDDPSEIQLKGCPKCKTLIRRSLRYANEVKKVHNDFEMIKKQQLVFKENELKKEIQGIKKDVKGQVVIEANLTRIESEVMSASQYLFPHRLNAMRNQLRLLPIIAKLYQILSQVKCNTCIFDSCHIHVKDVLYQVEYLQRFLMDNDYLLDQQLSDIKYEITRLDLICRLCDLYFKLQVSEASIASSDMHDLNANAEVVHCSGACGNPEVSEEIEQEINVLVQRISQKYAVNGITDAERADIVKAVNLSKGHWFKCPNGHLYCIGECGGAMEEAKCPECGATIGGRNHRLTDDNQLAPEMDGAQHAAWSEQANMENYDLQQFQ